MLRALEFPLFLAGAAGLHLAVLGGVDLRGEGAELPKPASMAAAGPALSALAARWRNAPEAQSLQGSLAAPPAPDRAGTLPQTAAFRAPEAPPLASPSAPPAAPQTAHAAPVAPPVPKATDETAPALRASQASPVPRQMAALPAAPAPLPPNVQMAEPAPPPIEAPEASLRPQTRPAKPAAPKAVRKAKAQPTAPQPARKAQTAGPSAQALLAEWGGTIRTRVAGRTARLRGTGTLRLSLEIGRDGRLGAVTLLRSSGDAALDRAAISAVRRMGRVPAAPGGLSGSSFRFPVTLRLGG